MKGRAEGTGIAAAAAAVEIGMRAAAGTTGIMMAAVESMTGMTAAADMRGISKAAEGEGPPRGTKAPSKRKEGRIGVGLTFSWSICVTRIDKPMPVILYF